MSHIVAHKTKTVFKNRTAIKEAIRLMAGSGFTGIRFEEKEDMILVRGYAPIEVYQQNGNLRLVLSEDKKSYEAHYDYWECGAEMKKTIAAFEMAYQKAGATALCKKWGFPVGKATKTENGERMIAQIW